MDGIKIYKYIHINIYMYIVYHRVVIMILVLIYMLYICLPCVYLDDGSYGYEESVQPGLLRIEIRVRNRKQMKSGGGKVR